MVQGTFRKARILNGQANHEIGKRLIQAIANDGALDFQRFIKVAKDEKIADELVAANVFAFNPANYTISFQSGILEEFVKEEYSKNFDVER
jgi:hypothetical protein